MCRKLLSVTAILISVAVSAEATYKELLDTLESNEAITTEQAAQLRDSAPSYTVRPASGVVTDLQIRGRVQAQFGYVDAKNDEGSDDFSTFEVRRARIGLRGTLPYDVRAQLEANLVPGSSFSMRSAFLQWRAHKPAYLKVGYDKPHSSLEENTSSANILTVERSLINGVIAAPGPLTGLSLDGTLQALQYGAGVYTDADNRNPGGTDAEYLYNAMLALSLDDWVGDRNTLRVQGVYLNSDDDEGAFGGTLDEAYTIAAHWTTAPFDLRAEYFAGETDGIDTTGFYVMPSLFLLDNLQAVVRYEYADSDNKKGLRAPSRYVRDVPSLQIREPAEEAPATATVDPQRGDEYQAVYVGLTYYFAGHGHKVMIGLEQAELKNTDLGTLDATSFTTAWRMLF